MSYNLLPVFTVVLAILFFGETMAPTEVLGGLAVLRSGTDNTYVFHQNIPQQECPNRNKRTNI